VRKRNVGLQDLPIKVRADKKRRYGVRIPRVGPREIKVRAWYLVTRYPGNVLVGKRGCHTRGVE